MKNFNEKEIILEFLRNHSGWLSGFTCGEGCFTGYLLAYPKAKWGLQLGLDFNITQSTNDRGLLEAIAEYLGLNPGSVYNKSNNISVVAVRNLKTINNNIISFFDEKNNELMGNKKIQYDIWKQIVLLANKKTHLKDTLEGKKCFLEIAQMLKILNNNSRIENIETRKIQRLNIIIKWLTELDKKPDLKQKIKLKTMLSNLN